MFYYQRSGFTWKLTFITGVFIIIAGIFFTIWLRSSIKSLEYRLGNLQQKQYQLMKEQRNLLAQKDNLLSIASIDHFAIKQMGFEFPDRNKVIYVKEANYKYGK